MAISTDTQIKWIWGCIASMLVGWTGGMIWTSNQYNDLKLDTQSSISCIRYDTGVELARINTSLQQVVDGIQEIKRDIRGEKK